MSFHGLIVLASVLLPLIGVAKMENGAFGNSIGMNGYPNGCFLVYGMYAGLLLVSYTVFRLSQTTVFGMPSVDDKTSTRFSSYAFLLMLFLVSVLFVKLFVFGGWGVWHGQTGKGEFRANLGSYGALAYLLIKEVIPMLMAYAAILYRIERRGWREHGWLAALIVVVLIIGSTWGFKTTGITMLIPALIVLFWGAAFGRVLVLCGVIAITIVFFFYVFDSQTDEAEAGLSFLMTRLTTLQGDVSWLLWDEYVQGVAFPPYLKTLLVFVGDRAFAQLTGITRDAQDMWADYHFDILIGSLVGLPLSVVKDGHSIVGTPFSDGLVLGGLPGVVVMAMFVGALCGSLCTLIEQSLRRGHTLQSALLVTYFGIHVVTFVRNGTAVQLFHIATIVGLLVASSLCMILSKLAIMFESRKPISE
jgi:hypothetical protein